MALPDLSINDLRSFNSATLESRQLAGVYFFYMLDRLIELANRVAHDFFDRPHLYTFDSFEPDSGQHQQVIVSQTSTIVSTLAKLHARYGCDERALASSQREQIYSALFGRRSAENGMHEAGDFARLRDGLLEACATFAETKFGDEGSLRENVLQKHRLFKEYVEGQDGLSLDWTRKDGLADLTEGTSYAILRNPGVTRVFTGARAPRAAWPYDFDSNADKLIEEISKQLMWPGAHDPTVAAPAANPGSSLIARESKPYITREEIVCCQRAALEGARCLATVVEIDSDSDDADVDVLIKRCYTWRTALRCVKGYWKTSGVPAEPHLVASRMGPIALGQPMSVAGRSERR